MQRREMLKVIGAAAALPFVPARADAAVRLAESVHRRLEVERAATGARHALRVLSPEQNELVTTAPGRDCDRADQVITDARMNPDDSERIPSFLRPPYEPRFFVSGTPVESAVDTFRGCHNTSWLVSARSTPLERSDPRSFG